jgi:hypothetical protein
MDYILERCIREIRNSKNADMLRVAKRYTDLYERVLGGFPEPMKHRVETAYKRKKEELI